MLRHLLCLVTAAKHGGSFKIAKAFEELPADVASTCFDAVYTRERCCEHVRAASGDRGLEASPARRGA